MKSQEMESKLSYVRERVREIIEGKFNAMIEAMVAKAKEALDKAIEAQKQREQDFIEGLPKSELVSAVFKTLVNADDQFERGYYREKRALVRSKANIEPLMQKISTKFKSEIAVLTEMVEKYDRLRSRHSGFDYRSRYHEIEAIHKVFRAKEVEVLDSLILANDKQMAKALADLAKWEPKL